MPTGRQRYGSGAPEWSWKGPLNEATSASEFGEMAYRPLILVSGPSGCPGARRMHSRAPRASLWLEIWPDRPAPGALFERAASFQPRPASVAASTYGRIEAPTAAAADIRPASPPSRCRDQAALTTCDPSPWSLPRRWQTAHIAAAPEAERIVGPAAAARLRVCYEGVERRAVDARRCDDVARFLVLGKFLDVLSKYSVGVAYRERRAPIPDGLSKLAA